MGALDYVEVTFAWLFANAKGNDAKLFTKGGAFAHVPTPRIKVTSPEIGASNSFMHIDHTPFGANRFPALTWSSNIEGIAEYMLIVEDPDAPLPSPPLHGLYYALPPTKTALVGADFENLQGNTLSGGFKLGKNLRRTIYGGPRPLLNHGPHRYFYTVVALSQPVDVSKLSPRPGKDELAVAIEGKVLGWGEWIGVYERKWT
jgi:phosphatidylethanolamine-binding protein (PEBP) family uncharacterized protein